jgi:hypothetical protein
MRWRGERVVFRRSYSPPGRDVSCGMRNAMRNVGVVLLAATGISLACRSVPRVASSSACPNPYSLATITASPPLPISPAAAPGRASIVGTVVDATSGRGINGASVTFVGTDVNLRDTVFRRTDSAGTFTAAVLWGQYTVSAGSANYHLFRSEFSTRSPVDTLRIQLKRSVPVCRVDID